MTTIKKIEFLYENQPSRRRLKITLSNGAKIKAESCYESWQQWGGTTDDLYITMPIVEANNEWLHGGEKSTQNEANR